MSFSKSFLLYSVAIFILGLAVVLRVSWQQKEQVLPKDQYIKLVATLKREPRIYNASQVLEIGDGKVYSDLYPRYKVGDRLQIAGEIDSQGRIYRAKIEKLGEGQGDWVFAASRWMGQLRSRISQNISQLLPAREATLIVGTVLGVDDIERQFRDQLIKTGTIHVVVVSGQNLMIVASVFLTLGKYLGKRFSLFLALFVSLLYAALTGFEPPVVRATLMVAAATLAVYFGRESLPIWNLLMAAVLILFVWPQAIFEISFQLTFAATLGIMTLGQSLAKVFVRGPVASFLPASARSRDNSMLDLKSMGSLRAVGNPSTDTTPHKKALGTRDTLDTLGTLVINNAAIAISAYIFTAPIILYYFGRVSLVAPLANILVLEAVFPVMILGFLVAISSLFLISLAQILAYFAYVPAFYFVKAVEIFAKLPVGQVSLGKGSIWMVMGFYVLLLSLMWIWRRESKSKWKV